VGAVPPQAAKKAKAKTTVTRETIMRGRCRGVRAGALRVVSAPASCGRVGDRP
jgi:hypothetical protein